MAESRESVSLSSTPFAIQDCVLASVATGVKAQNARDFCEKISLVPLGCIFFHFWGGRLRSTVESWEFHNDFSYWASHCLHDDTLAERLEILDPTAYGNIEDLRSEIIEIFESRLDEIEHIPWVKQQEQFHFIHSKIVVFNTRFAVKHPNELVNIIPHLSTSSIFYHFIDARRRTPGNEDDFSAWLKGLPGDYGDLIFQLKKIDPFFISLSDLQAKLITVVMNHFLGEQNVENNGA